MNQAHDMSLETLAAQLASVETTLHERLDALENRLLESERINRERYERTERTNGIILQSLRVIAEAVSVSETIAGLVTSLEQHSRPPTEPRTAAARRRTRTPKAR